MDEKFIKITNSTYKVLEFLPEAETLKQKANEKVLSIMESLAFIFAQENFAGINCWQKINEALSDVDIFLSYLKIAKDRGWLDTINFLILEKEYKAIETDLSKLKEKCSSRNDYPVVQSNTSEADGANPKQPEPVKKNGELTERQKKILEIVQKNEKTQVSDIIKVLPDVTKRTIRRDMDELLKSGMVLRVGEFNQIFYKFAKNSLGQHELS